MASRIELMGLLLTGILSLLLLYVYGPRLSEGNFSLFTINIKPISPIIRTTYTCKTWQNISFIDATKYQACLTSYSDASFWSVQGLRHTAHKHLFNSSSLIIEVGGNRAHDTVEFIKFHNPFIMSYEPLRLMAKNLSDMFRSNPKVQIFPYGFGNRARNMSIEPNDYGNAGTSLYRPLTSPNSSNIVQVEILDIVEVIDNIRRTKTRNGMIDMISINCEGCEFEIIPALLINNLTQFFRVIQFASHMGLVQDSPCIYCQIKQGLERTHTTLFYYSKLWEGWVLKNKTNI